MATVELPLPDDTFDAVRLLIHEGFHVIQPSVMRVPAAESSNGKDLLQSAEGRTWLRLECVALADALEATGDARRAAIEDALLFRARRYLAAVEPERFRETTLDVTEGLPEYTGWKLAGDDGHAFARHLRAKAAGKSSFVRGFPYMTGRAVAFLLDAVRGEGWRHDARELENTEAARARAIGSSTAAAVEPARVAPFDDKRLRQRAEARGTERGLAEVRRVEDEHAETLRRKVAELEAKFVRGPTLRIPVGSSGVTFDPDEQVALGDNGTVMKNLGWRDASGAELTIPTGGLISADWSEVRVPLDGVSPDAGVLQARRTLQGAAWTLTLTPGWRLKREGASWRAIRPST